MCVIQRRMRKNRPTEYQHRVFTVVASILRFSQQIFHIAIFSRLFRIRSFAHNKYFFHLLSQTRRKECLHYSVLMINIASSFQLHALISCQLASALAHTHTFTSYSRAYFNYQKRNEIVESLIK